MFSSRNKLLAALSQPEADLLSSDLQTIELAQGQVIAQASVPLSHVYFIESGVVEETREEAGHSVAVGLIGAEGIVGIQAALGVREAYLRATVTLAGQAQRIAIDRFDAACRRCPELHASVLRFAHSMSVQLAETVWGTARLSVDTRLARYLSMLGDRAEGKPMKITHEALATSLGVRRPGVTVAVHYLEGDHLIKASRGLITIIDPESLRARGARRADPRAEADGSGATSGQPFSLSHTVMK